MRGEDDGSAVHARADYILEMGVWRATCRSCGHSVSADSRRAAAALFRNHSRQVRSANIIDLREQARLLIRDLEPD